MSELGFLKRKLARERMAREQAENILEQKALELYQANLSLQKLNDALELTVMERTKALQASENQYRQLVETATDLIFNTDIKGIFTYLNPVIEQKLGYGKEEILGKHFTEFVDESYRDHVRHFFKDVLKEKRTNSYLEFPVRTKSGHLLWLGQNTQLIWKDKEILQFTSVARDISQRIETETALQTTKLRLSNLIVNLHTGILMEDENRRIVLANQTFCNLFGIPVEPELLKGEDCSQTAQQTRHLFKDADIFVARIDELLLNRERAIGDELEMKDGRILIRDYIPIFVGERYLGHLWQYQDVTAEKTASERLRKSEEKYRGIMENMELGLLELDNDGKIIHVYDRLCEMLGYRPEELVGMDSIETLFPEEFIPDIRQQHADRLLGKTGVLSELQLLRKDRSRIWVLVSSAPIYDEIGEITGTIAIYHDISPQKKLHADLEAARIRAEAAEQAEKQFLARMSHELRTPMNAVVGMSHLLSETDVSEQQRDYVDTLKVAARILQNLLNDILDLSKISAGQVTPQKNPFDLIQLVLDLEQVFSMKLKDKPVDVLLRVDPRIRNLVVGDDLLLNQILINLLGNAIKFTHEGSITLDVGIQKRDNHQLSLRFQVIDTGIGIPEDKLPRIFQRFRQADEDTKRRYGGTGLGLSIVKSLVELQGGSIEVRSEVGKGTTFEFFLTYPEAERSINTSTVDDKPESVVDVAAFKGAHVLVVEDNFMNRKYLGKLLDKWGITYDMAFDGFKGIEMMVKRPYDIIFLDIQMPGMDGYEVAGTIRQTPGPNHDATVIALTASALLDQKNRAFEAGMDDFLGKPFTPDQLKQVIGRRIGTKSSNSQVNSNGKPPILETPTSPVLEEPELAHAIIPIEPNPSPDTSSLATEPLAEVPMNPSFSTPYHPSLDNDYLTELYEDDYEYALDMFETFLEHTLPEFKELTTDIQNREADAIRQTIHKLKPSFGWVGLTKPQENMQQIETMLKDASTVAMARAKFREVVGQLDEKLPIIYQERDRMKELLKANV